MISLRALRLIDPSRLRTASLPNRGRSQPAAFTIIELLFVLSMYALIALAGGRLFRAAIHVGTGTAAAQNLTATTESALAAMRADVWSASQIKIGKNSVMLVPSEGGAAVTWSSAGATLTRHLPVGRDRTWPIATGVTFTVESPSLQVHFAPTETAAGGDVQLVSQVQLLARLKP